MLESLLRERYKLISVLGAGGFGQTYLAEDLASPQPYSPQPYSPQPYSPQPYCVVKQFKPNKAADHFLEIARRLFDTEVKTLERLGRHPQIPAFIDFFEEAGEFYLVQEFIAGESLSDKVSAFQRFSEAEAIDLLRDVLGILAFVHSQQVIHRDIKPSNLICRQADRRIVLIDFGAVKEIQTQLQEEEQKFTVGIGTQGYTPSEQLAGRPRYCSDIYALGVTVIQTLTGLQPTQLLANPETGDLIWQAPISRELRSILEKMVRYHFMQRYQSAQEVLQALERLAQAPLESTLIPSSLVMPDSLLHHPVSDQTLFDRPVGDVGESGQEGIASRSKQTVLKQLQSFRVLAIAALGVTGLLAGSRQLGWLQAPELGVYDQLVRLQPDPGVDPHLLVVEINEADLQALKRGTPSDQDVATVIKNLLAAQPRAIGLDLHRDLPQEPGHSALMQQLQSPNVITIMKLGDEQKPFDILPPAGIPAERLGFNDFPIDPDGVVRRNLLYATAGGKSFTSLGLQLATWYLQSEQITPQASSKSAGAMQLGQTTFLPIDAAFGGYQQIDAAGYQIMLDYRSPQQPARQVSFTAVLDGQFDPSWVKDKVVLIGTTALSGKDLFYTPFSSGKLGEYLMPGVIIHAQIVSQLLNAVLEGKPLRSAWPNWVELVWIGSWALVGGSIAWVSKHPLVLGTGMVAAVVILAGSTYLIFIGHSWMPSVTPAIALILTGATVVSWRFYHLSGPNLPPVR
jgi:CHASE2 domain-containing sensor protein